MPPSKMSQSFEPGQRLSYGGELCTVRYVGDVAGTSGTWLGVEWDDPSRGKHDGAHKGVRYFACRSTSPTAGSFVRLTRPADWPRTFVEAVHDKYASEVTADRTPVRAGRDIVISGKVAEEVGFDKIRRQLANVAELKIVILDALCITSAGPGPGEKSIRETCPRIVELDLSRNLLAAFGTVVDVCEQLADLRSLRVNGNRFEMLAYDERLRDAKGAFKGVKDLAVEETLLSWDDICLVTEQFPSLNTLFAGTNQFTSLTAVPRSSPMLSALTSLSLEYNNFTSIADLGSLAALASLRNLHLKGNNISTLASSLLPSTPIPVFPSALRYVDLSYNQVAAWAFIDALPSVFPGLTSFRIAHNPVYDRPALEAAAAAAASSSSGPSHEAQGATSATEEAYMLTLARLPSLASLNFSTITGPDRANAEMFYLSRIARQLADVPAGGPDEAAVLARHRRWAELCDTYGEPAVVRRSAAEVNPNFLEARLITVDFHFHSPPRADDDDGTAAAAAAGDGSGPLHGRQVAARVPRSLDMYAVKGLAGRLFGLPPLGLRLVWETGEWDPVADYDVAVGESSDDEEDDVQDARDGDGKGQATGDAAGTAGRWIKREVELGDSPRQFGFCVDGPEARIRVEPRRRPA